MPSSLALVSLITITAAAPSLSGHALPAVTLPSGRNTGFSSASFSTVVPARGPSSFVTTVPSGERDRRDLPLEEAVLLRRRPRAAATARRTRPSPRASTLLDLGARSPRSGPSRCRRRAGRSAASTCGWPPLGARLRARVGLGELRVGRAGVGRAVLEAAHGLDAAGDEHVALAGLDRVRGHADRLQRRRAVAVDGDARARRHAGEDRRRRGRCCSPPRRRAGRSP